MSPFDFSLPEGVQIQNPPDTDILLSIGAVAYQWSYLEELFHQGIMYAKGLDPTNLEVDFQGRRETYILDIKRRTRMLLQNVRGKISKEQFQILKEHCDYIRDILSKKRNRTIHGLWVGTNDQNLSLRLTYKKETSKQVPLMKTPTDILGVVEEIIDAQKKLSDLLAEFKIRPII